MRVNRIPNDTMMDRETIGRFSGGMERLGPSPVKARAGRFSTGMERLDARSLSDQIGRFSTGMERLDASAWKDHVGRFSVGMEQEGSRDRPRSSMPDAA